MMHMKYLFAFLAVMLMLGCVSPPEEPPENVTPPKGCYSPCHIDLGSEKAPRCIASEGPAMCTLEFRLGDACLTYVHCDMSEGDCQTVLDPDFEGCVSCYKTCIEGIPEGGDVFTVCDQVCGSKFSSSTDSSA